MKFSSVIRIQSILSYKRNAQHPDGAHCGIPQIPIHPLRVVVGMATMRAAHRTQFVRVHYRLETSALLGPAALVRLQRAECGLLLRHVTLRARLDQSSPCGGWRMAYHRHQQRTPGVLPPGPPHAVCESSPSTNWRSRRRHTCPEHGGAVIRHVERVVMRTAEPRWNGRRGVCVGVCVLVCVLVCVGTYFHYTWPILRMILIHTPLSKLHLMKIIFMYIYIYVCITIIYMDCNVARIYINAYAYISKLYGYNNT